MSRAARWTSRFDAALTALLVVGAVAQTLGRGGDHVGLRAMLAGATVGGLLIRRTAPLVSVCWIAAGLAVESLATESPDEIAVLLSVVISAFSVAAWAPARDAVVGLVLLAMGTSLTITVDPSDSISNIPPTLLLFLALPAGLGFAFRRRGRDLATLELTAEALKLEAANAVDAERRRIAREMHDVVSHAVTLIAVQSEAGQSVLTQDQDAARRAFEAIGHTSRDALAELHSMVALLRDPADRTELSRGLDSLPTLLEGARGAGVAVTVVEGERSGDLRPDVDHCAFRVVQEGLTNALRHSQRPVVHITIQSDEHQLDLGLVSTGIAHQSTYGGSGNGLRGLRERVAALGGILEFGPIDDGFSLRVTLPQAAP